MMGEKPPLIYIFWSCAWFVAKSERFWPVLDLTGKRVNQDSAQFHRKMPSRYTNRMRKILRVVFALTAVSLFAVGSWFVFRPGRRFDPSLWGNSQTPASVRLRMADDLVDNKKLVGLTRQEVVARLGEPPKTEYFKEFDLVYYLGPERGFMSIDSEWLVLKLGPDGRVVKATIARD